MIVIDENIIGSQKLLLRNRRYHVQQIGFDLGTKGMKDEDIIPLLHQLKGETFFTRDSDFFKRTLCHTLYCLVYLHVGRNNEAGQRKLSNFG